MAEKEAFGRYNSIRAFFGFRRYNKFVLRRKNNSNSLGWNFPALKLSALNSQFSIQKGFTLIELLLVIAILSIMAVVLITLLNPITQIQKANDTRRKSDLAQLQKTLEAYYSDNGRYPFSSISTTTGCTDTPVAYHISSSSTSTGCMNWNSSWGPYNTTLPKDPSSSKYYVYYSNSTGQSYWLYASLERGGSDPQACYSTGAACANVAGQGIVSTCGATCNYGVSSSNTSP